MNYAKLHLTSLDFYFRGSRDYMRYMEDFIEKAKASFDDDYPIDENLKDTQPEYYHFLIDDLSERWHQVDCDFPNDFRSSYLSQLYSGIDTHLRRICDRYHKAKKTSKSVKQIKSGSDLEKSRRFLIEFAKIDFADLESDFAFLNNIRKIRNQIVHHHGSINSKNSNWEDVKSFINSNPDTIKFKNDINELDDEGILIYKSRPSYSFKFLIVSPRINVELLNVSERFFKKLLESKINFDLPV